MFTTVIFYNNIDFNNLGSKTSKINLIFKIDDI